MLSQHLMNTDRLRKEPGAGGGDGVLAKGRRSSRAAREMWVLWGAASLVQGRRRSPAPQRTSRPQLTDVAVRRRAQVRVTLPGRPKPHTALGRGGVWLPRQPVLAALQAKGLAPRRRARLSTLHSREANPYVQAPADGREGGDSGGLPKDRHPSAHPLEGRPLTAAQQVDPVPASYIGKPRLRNKMWWAWPTVVPIQLPMPWG